MSTKHNPVVCAICEVEGALLGPRDHLCPACKIAKGLYRTTVGNLTNGFNRKYKGAPEMLMALEEFCRWRTRTKQTCHYCGISEIDIPRVGMKSQVQKAVRTMGIDRLDSSLGYSTSNIRPCCFVCNQIKGDRFSESEMMEIGPAVGRVWRRRIG
jgi:hypothetical protein